MFCADVVGATYVLSFLLSIIEKKVIPFPMTSQPPCFHPISPHSPKSSVTSTDHQQTKENKTPKFLSLVFKAKTHQIHLEFSASTHLFTHAVFSTFSIPDLHQLKSFSRLSSDASSSRKPSLVSPAKGLLSPLNTRAIFLPLLWQCYSLSCSLTIKGDAVDLPH